MNGPFSSDSSSTLINIFCVKEIQFVRLSSIRIKIRQNRLSIACDMAKKIVSFSKTVTSGLMPNNAYSRLLFHLRICLKTQYYVTF